MADPDPVTLPLGQRLMESFKAFLGTAISAGVDPDGRLEAARQALTAIVFRRRDEDTVKTPEADPDKEPRLVCSAVDEGRYKPYAPIRNFRLDLAIQANALVPNGQSDAFHAACGALEALLDGLNLQIALSSDTWKIAVMLAVREPGCAFSMVPRGDKASLRRQSYALKIRAVGLEHTTTGGLPLPPDVPDNMTRQTGDFDIPNATQTFDIPFDQAFDSIPAYADVIIHPPNGQAAISVHSITRAADKLTVVLDAATAATGYTANWFAFLV